MKKIVIRLAAFGFALFTITLAPFAKADEWNRKTVIITHQPIRIKGKVLESGQYVMKLLDSPSDRRILQIFNAAETKLEMTIFANSAYRPESTGDNQFVFSETGEEAPALLTWFYPGDNSGLEFPVAR